MKHESDELFDWALFGVLLRNQRKEAGYSNADEFAQAVYNRTRVKIKSDSIYKIESGKQAPSAMQLFALCLTLGIGASEFMARYASACMSKEWQEVSEGASMSCEATEPPRGAFKRGKRGAIVYENELGTLETAKVTNGRGTFWGSCIIDGVEHTRKMSGDKAEVCSRWEKWQQSLVDDKREREARKEVKPMEQVNYSGKLDAIAAALARIAEALELIALKEPASASVKDGKSGVAAFCAAHNGLEFINRTTVDVYADVAGWCKANGYAAPSQRAVTNGFKEHYANVLDFDTNGARTMCKYKGGC